MIHKEIKSQIIESMRAKDTLRLETLRGLQASFSNELIAKKSNEQFLKDEDVLIIIKRAVKQRKDSIEQFEKGGRKDLAKKEKDELNILESFLPQMMSEEEIKKVVKAKLENSGSIDKAKQGQFIGMIIKELKGKADGSDVKKIVDDILNR